MSVIYHSLLPGTGPFDAFVSSFATWEIDCPGPRLIVQLSQLLLGLSSTKLGLHPSHTGFVCILYRANTLFVLFYASFHPLAMPRDTAENAFVTFYLHRGIGTLIWSTLDCPAPVAS